MIIEVIGDLPGRDGVLVIDDKSAELLIRTEKLPDDVVLKTYLQAVRRKQRSGSIQSAKDHRVCRWEVLGQVKAKRTSHPTTAPAVA
jgi:hypothetical protein